MADPKVSVLTLVYNRRDDARELLRKLEEQTYPDFETIVIDNGSADGTSEMVRNEFPQARLIRIEQNVGLAKGYNTGLLQARGEYLVLVDSDAILPEPDAIDQIVGKFAADPRLGIASIPVYSYYTKELMWDNFPVDMQDGDDERGYCTGGFNGCAVGLRKRALDEAGLFDEDFFIYVCEVDLSIRVLARGYEVRFFPAIKVEHKVSEQRKETAARAYYVTRNTLWYIWKYQQPWTAVLRDSFKSTFYRQVQVYVRRHPFPRAWLRGLVDALKRLPAVLRQRQPVPKEVYARIVNMAQVW